MCTITRTKPATASGIVIYLSVAFGAQCVSVDVTISAYDQCHVYLIIVHDTRLHRLLLDGAT